MIELLKSLLRWFGLAVVGAIAMLALTLALAVIIAPRVDLSSMRPRLEALAGQAVGRSVELRGPMAVTLSLPPLLEAAQVRIGSKSNGSSGEFALIDKISVSVALIPLLRKQIVIPRIEVNGMRLTFAAAEDGQDEWTFRAGEQPSGADDWKLVAINDLSLHDLVLQFKRLPQQPAVEVRLGELISRLPADDPMHLETAGTVQGLPFSLDATTGPLSQLLTAGAIVPVNATLELNNNQVQVNGALALERQQVDARFQLHGERVADLAALVDVSLPVIGAYRLQGELSGSLSKLTISEIDGHVGRTVFSGDLQLGMKDERMRLEGSLTVTTLDAGPWLVTNEKPVRNGPTVDTSAAVSAVPDVDLRLQVDEFLNLPVAIEDASLSLKLRGDALTAPMQFKLDGVVVQGDIGVDRKNGDYRATASLRTQQLDIADFIKRYSDLTGVTGTVGTFAIEAFSQGTQPGSLIDNLGVNVQVQNATMSYGNRPGETQIGIDLDEMTVHVPPQQRAQVSINGRLLDEPFAVDLSLGDLPTLLADRSLPFDLYATGAGAELTMSGQLADETSTDDTTLRVQLSGKRFGGLAPWLGVSPDVNVPYSLSGQLKVQSDGDAWQLSRLYARLGHSSMEGAIGRSRLKSRPLLQASMAFDVIDLVELDHIFADDPFSEQKNSTVRGVDMDMPILPKSVNLKDMDIDIKVKRVVVEPSDITDIAFSTRIRDGYVSNAPFRGTLAETRFSGSLAMDLRRHVPEIRLDLEALDVNVGDFLRDLQLATEIDAHSRRLTAQVVARGSSMSELFNHAEIKIEAYSGRWFLTDPNKAGGVDIEVSHGTAEATTKTRQTVVKLDARIGKVPMDFTLETKRLPKTADGKEYLDLRIRANAAGAELTMQGLAPRLSGLRDLDMHVSVRGDRIDTLDELLKVSLPPFGPYSIGGRLRIVETEYKLSNIDVRVGDTIAKGEFKVSTAGAKPKLSWVLEAETFQLDDFRLGKWTPVPFADKNIEAGESLDLEFRGISPTTEIDNNIVEAGISRKSVQQPKKSEKTQAEAVRPLLSRELMHGFDGQADFRVAEVLSGQDRLGSGEMSIALQNGKLSLSLDINVPGGDVALELDLRANEHDFAATLRNKIENFDYGVFARRFKPDTDMSGKFSLDVDVAANAETWNSMAANANGHFDFVIWPQTLRSGVFDMWTANLFFVVLPMLNLQAQSKVNCVVGRFDMKDGIMEPKPLFMDTTGTQVNATGEVNFRSKRIKLRLTPRSKRPKFFSLSTPLVVEGGFSNFGVSLRPHDLLGTTIRMAYTVVLVPFEYVIHGVRPPLDTGECEKPLGIREGR